MLGIGFEVVMGWGGGLGVRSLGSIGRSGFGFAFISFGGEMRFCLLLVVEYG